MSKVNTNVLPETEGKTKKPEPENKFPALIKLTPSDLTLLLKYLPNDLNGDEIASNIKKQVDEIPTEGGDLKISSEEVCLFIIDICEKDMGGIAEIEVGKPAYTLYELLAHLLPDLPTKKSTKS